jgi:hypothetical protein
MQKNNRQLTVSPSLVDLSKMDPLQKQFFQLQKKIENLQKKQVKQEQELDACLHFYINHVLPAETALQSALHDRVLLTYNLYSEKKHFTSKEHKIIKKMLLDDLNLLFNLCDISDISAQVKEIFSKLSDVSFDQMIANEFDDVKKEIEALLKAEGMNIDLSGIDFSMDPKTVSEKIFNSIDPAAKTSTGESKTQSKTKKQKELEASKQLEYKSLSSLYKKLAKHFHPDLEHDTQKKEEKEKVMKKLTSAYKSQDLYTLLQLEIQTLPSSCSSLCQEQLKIYNKILENQIKSLKQSKNDLVFLPKYALIQKFYRESQMGFYIAQAACIELTEDAYTIKKWNEKLKTEDALRILKNATLNYE